MLHYFIIFMSLLCLTLFTGCGGGGGVGGGVIGSTQPTAASLFETDEFLRQEGLALINASSMYAAGGTGANVKVGVADSGINQVETLASSNDRINIDATASFNFDGANVAGSASDNDGHGTHVAGIIAAPKNDVGVHGIAFDATVANYRIMDNAGIVSATDADLAQMLSIARANDVNIMNNSWGSNVAINDAGAAGQIAALTNFSNEAKTYVANGGVLVFAAGNSGRANPSAEAGIPEQVVDLEAGWIVVMAVDLNGNEPIFTNRCGVASDYCIAAPGGGDLGGTGVLSMDTVPDSTVRLSGTSQAAPHVSGALAALKSLFPTLTLQQIRSRLFTTANKTGSFANTSIFGQGLMDLNAASNPVGGLSIPTSGSITGAKFGVAGNGVLSSNQIVLPRAVLHDLNLQKNVLVVDNFQNAPFQISTQYLVSAIEAKPRYQPYFAKFNSRKKVNQTKSSFRAVSYSDGYQGLQSHWQSGTFSYGIGHYSLRRSVDESAIKLPQSILNRLDGNNVSAIFSHSLNEKVLSVAYTDHVSDLATNYADKTDQNTPYGYSRALSISLAFDINQGIYLGLTSSKISQMQRPLGLDSSGVFSSSENREVDNYGFLLGKTFGLHRFGFGLSIDDFDRVNGPLIQADKTSMVSKTASWSFDSPSGFELYSRLNDERYQGGTIRLTLPESVDAQGQITRKSYLIDLSDSLSSIEAVFGMRLPISNSANFRSEATYRNFGNGDGLGGISVNYEKLF